MGFVKDCVEVGLLRPGILTEGEGSVQLTSLYKPVQISRFNAENIHFLLYTTNYLNEEVKRTGPSPSVRVP